MKKIIKITNILDKEDAELLRAKIDADVKCPNCKKTWHSPFPKTRHLCPKCFKKLTGLEYTQ